MKYKVGDRVRVQSLDWYNKNKNKSGNIPMGQFSFNYCNTHLCGTILTIKKVQHGYYLVEENSAYWTDEMIEGAVEPELTAPTIMDGSIILNKWFETNQEIVCPEDYEFFDETGNIIETQRVFIRKKKKEYPKNYEECCEVLHYAYGQGITMRGVTEEEDELFRILIVLKRCRDAYWKIAGEEMGLGKPWKPNDSSGYCTYAILRHTGHIRKSRPYADSALLEFPTEEMRDAFMENFDPDIEFCKELL